MRDRGVRKISDRSCSDKLLTNGFLLRRAHLLDAPTPHAYACSQPLLGISSCSSVLTVDRRRSTDSSTSVVWQMLLDDFVPPAPAKGAPTATARKDPTATVTRRKDPKIWTFEIFGQMGAPRERAIPVLPAAPKNAQSARSQSRAPPQVQHPRHHSAPRVREAEPRQTSQHRDCSRTTSLGTTACPPEMSMIPNGEADQGTAA